jgi:hypothetical protein
MPFRHSEAITRARRIPLMLAALTAASALLATPVTRAAFLPLPATGAQVNDDPVNSIDPSLAAGISDVAGGAVTAGKVEVPWATFEQRVAGGEQQIFVRAFKNGAWVTQGLPASLNIDPTEEAEAPSIDFAGTGRTVPWVAWYEPSAAAGWPTNIFASRFNVAANRWLPSGQGRGPVHLPSLNIHTLRTAEHPSVAGGATVAGNDPVPWITWEENDGVPNDGTTLRQIFVAKALKQAVPGTACPVGTKPTGGVDVNGFCWQQVGLDRLNPSGPLPSDTRDPTLNIDPTRSGVEPAIAFTGPNDTVAWVVWYEEDPTQIDGLRSNDMVFAAKIVADGTADGGFRWVAFGNGTAGQTNALDTSGAHGFGNCAESQDAEDACALNAVASRDAENPRVAAGTLKPGGATVPWVVWQEDVGGGTHAVFVSRLVGGDHFELFNSGHPVSNTTNDATRPDITFSGNVPYISWLENVSGAEVTFVGHFEGGASAPAFKLDTPTGIPNSAFGPNIADPPRVPISSGCAANPTNADGASCQGGAVGTPFVPYTAGSPGAQHLFAQAFAPTDVSTLAATDVSETDATLNGSANPDGAAILTHFDFGATTAYGTSTADARLDVASVATAFDATVSGLTHGATVHFRAVAKTDFVTVDGPDQSFTTSTPVPTTTPESSTTSTTTAVSTTTTATEPSPTTTTLAPAPGEPCVDRSNGFDAASCRIGTLAATLGGHSAQDLGGKATARRLNALLGRAHRFLGSVERGANVSRNLKRARRELRSFEKAVQQALERKRAPIDPELGRFILGLVTHATEDVGAKQASLR